MRFHFRRFIEDLSGRSDRSFMDLVLEQIETTLEGAYLVRRVVTSGEQGSIDHAWKQIEEVEHKGDERRERLVTELSQALITPIDREDLFRVSRAIDDVLDNLRDFLREWELYDVNSRDAFSPMLEAVIKGLRELQEAVSELTVKPSAVARGALASKKAGNEIRRLYQLKNASLFKEELSMEETLECRELLRRLDIVGLRLGEAADYLADASVKRSH